MNLIVGDPDPADPQRIVIEAARTIDRLRSLSPARLRAELPDGGTRAQRTLRLAQDLADQTAVLAGWPQRSLPQIPDTAAGNVLAVCATDLVEVVLAESDPGVTAEVSTSVTSRLIALRLVL